MSETAGRHLAGQQPGTGEVPQLHCAAGEARRRRPQRKTECPQIAWWASCKQVDMSRQDSETTRRPEVNRRIPLTLVRCLGGRGPPYRKGFDVDTLGTQGSNFAMEERHVRARVLIRQVRDTDSCATIAQHTLSRSLGVSQQ